MIARSFANLIIVLSLCLTMKEAACQTEPKSFAAPSCFPIEIENQGNFFTANVTGFEECQSACRATGMREDPSNFYRVPRHFFGYIVTTTTCACGAPRIKKVSGGSQVNVGVKACEDYETDSPGGMEPSSSCSDLGVMDNNDCVALCAVVYPNDPKPWVSMETNPAGRTACYCNPDQKPACVQDHDSSSSSSSSKPMALHLASIAATLSMGAGLITGFS